MESLEFAARLFGAMNTRPSRFGNRQDKKVCDAKSGECRYNSDHYTSGMRDEKCDNRCPYLISIANK